MGADRAILVMHDGIAEPLAVAKLLKAIAGEEQPGLIILGKQAIDDDSNQTGQMLAALLGWAQGTFANKVEVSGESVHVTREVDGGREMAVFVVEAGRARLVPVEIGDRNGVHAWVRQGLAEGDRVVVYPPSQVKDGVRVSVRED